MSSGNSRLSTAETGVFWDLDHCPIPNYLSPASVSDNIKSALNNMGYTGQVSINAYTDTEHIGKDFESAGIKLIRLGDNRSNRKNRGEILSDMCMWAAHHRRKITNLMLISKDVSEDASYVTGLLTIKSQAHNILLAQPLNASGLLRQIPSSFWLWTSLSIGGLPLGGSQVVTPPSLIIGDNQTGTSQTKPCSKKRKSRFLTAETVVFWNLDQCPIPNDLSPASIVANIKLALKNLGYTGRVSISAYSSANQIKKEFDLVNINLIQIHYHAGAARVLMENHFFSWWGVIHRSEPGNLLVISKEDVAMFVGFAHSYKNDNNLLLAHPQYTTEEIPCTASSIWLWATLSYGGSPFHNRSLKSQNTSPSPTTFSVAETHVLWDLDTCPISEDLSPCSISDNIKSALKNMGYTDQVSIVAYTEHIKKDFEGDGIKLIRLETNLAKYERMFLDVCLWGTRCHNQPSNLMVISSKDIFDSDFVKVLAEIRDKGNNILLALPHHASKLLWHTSTSIWRWNTLSTGGLPLDNQSGSSQIVTSSPSIWSPHPASKKMKRWTKPCNIKGKSRANTLSKD